MTVEQKILLVVGALAIVLLVLVVQRELDDCAVRIANQFGEICLAKK